MTLEGTERPLRYKKVDVKVNTKDDGGDGEFVAYASTFVETPDSYGDIVAPGAFTSTLEKWAGSGQNIPILWGHDFSDPFMNIGHVLEAKEDDYGLLVTGKLDLDNPTAKQVYRLLKGSRVNKMSFAFDEVAGGHKRVEGKDVYEIQEVHLYEVSVVPIPSNPTAEVLQVKGEGDSKPPQFTTEEMWALKRLALALVEGGEEDEPADDEEDEDEDSASEEEEADGKSGAKPKLGEGTLGEAALRVQEDMEKLLEREPQ